MHNAMTYDHCILELRIIIKILIEIEINSRNWHISLNNSLNEISMQQENVKPI